MTKVERWQDDLSGTLKRLKRLKQSNVIIGDVLLTSCIHQLEAWQAEDRDISQFEGPAFLKMSELVTDYLRLETHLPNR